jgi:putative ATP-binding cassette transporter
MTESAGTPLSDDKRPHRRGSVRAYWRLAGAYWKGPTAIQAWSLTGVSFVLVVGNIAVQYGINLWNYAFFNALQQRDQTFA